MHAGFSRAPGAPVCHEWAVLVPGFTGSKEDFIAVLPLLAAEGIGVVSYDQLGQHESDGSSRESDYALERLADDLGEVVAVASEFFDRDDAPHVLGHSFGGLVVQEAVAGAAVQATSATLLCTGPVALPPDRWQGLPDLVAALEHSDLAAIWRIMHELDADEGAAAPDVRAFLEDRWHRNDPVQLRQVALLLMQQRDLVQRVRRVVDGGLPITVMWGEADDAWPIPVQADMAFRLGVPGVELPGVGHSPNVDDPRLTVDALLRAWRR